MCNEEPEPEIEQLAERVEHLEARMTQFERQLRSLPEPPAQAQDADVAAPPDIEEDVAPE